MKTNFLLISLSKNTKEEVAEELAKLINMHYANLDNIFDESSEHSLRKLARMDGDQLYNLIKAEHLLFIESLQNTVFVTDLSGILNEKVLNDIKRSSIVIFIDISKIDYLEESWKLNLNERAKFKVDETVFNARREMFKKCADIVLETDNNNPKVIAKKLANLIKKEKVG